MNEVKSVVTPQEIRQLDEQRQQITAPYGMDAEEVLEIVPKTEEMIATVEEGLVEDANLKDAITRITGDPLITERLLKTESFSAMGVSRGENAYLKRNELPNGRKDIRSHWKKLFRDIPPTADARSIGDFVLFTQEIFNADGVQNNIHLLVDLREGKSTKSKGLKVDILQENEKDKHVLNVSKDKGFEINTYYKSRSWLVETLDWKGVMGQIGINKDEKSIKLYRFSMNPQAPDFIAMIAGHERIHLKQNNQERLFKDKDSAFILSHLLIDMSMFMSAWAMFSRSNPWLFIASSLATAALYTLSRTKGNLIHSGFNKLLAIEAEAYFSSAIYSNVLKKKGYITKGEDIPPKLLGEHLSKYQPLTWYFLEKIDKLIHGDTQPEPQPKPAYQSLTA